MLLTTPLLEENQSESTLHQVDNTQSSSPAPVNQRSQSEHISKFSIAAFASTDGGKRSPRKGMDHADEDGKAEEGTR